MIIKCPECNFSRDVGDVRIPPKGAMAVCPSCTARFMLMPEQPARETHQPRRSCPSCSFAHPHGDMSESCPECGLVYAKFLKRQQGTQEPPPAPPVECAPPGSPETGSGGEWLFQRKTLLGLLGVLFVAICLRYGHDWKLDKEYRLVPSTWRGEVTYLGKQFPFVLVIESAADGKLAGYTDWDAHSPRIRLAVRGTYTGNHLIFEDYKFLEGNGAYGLHDWKDVYIAKNVMDGSDKNGDADFHAVRLDPGSK